MRANTPETEERTDRPAFRCERCRLGLMSVRPARRHVATGHPVVTVNGPSADIHHEPEGER